MWGPLILTDVVPVGVLCVKLPYSVMTGLGLGGTCGSVTATQLLLLGCGKFSRLFTVVLGLTLV